MTVRRAAIFIIIGTLAVAWVLHVAFTRSSHLLPQSRDIAEIRARVSPDLRRDLAARDLSFGAPVFLRIFKEESTLELWVRDGPVYRKFRDYEICNYSGHLGPKLREGDRQSPEGFYSVPKSALNPNSSYHLSFNLGFPNRFDRDNDRTGSFLMVHGDCVSVGCYAMRDTGIEEIYLLVEAALDSGQDAVPVHAFPFRMHAARMTTASDSRWYGFWTELKAGYDAFEANRVPPVIKVVAGTYVVDDG